MSTHRGTSSPSIARRPQDHMVADTALALCWIPFAAAGWLFRSDASVTGSLVAATLLLSFAHQPLTLALVYGDKRTFDLRRRTFMWSPILLAAAILAAQHISLTALAVVAGLWNTEHTLMQRYGVMRIHGRKAGRDDGRFDKALLFSWLAVALVWIASDNRTADRIAQTGLRGRNRQSLELLAALQPASRLLLALVVIVAGVVTARWLRDEVDSGTSLRSRKTFYVASTAALFVTILLAPIPGFLGYVGAHAVEYFIIVHRSVGPKYQSAEGDGHAPVGYAIRALGRLGFFAAYIAVVAGALTVLERHGNPTLYTVVVLTLGGMHVLYDGFIWKRPVPGKGGMLASSSQSLPATPSLA